MDLTFYHDNIAMSFEHLSPEQQEEFWWYWDLGLFETLSIKYIKIPQVKDLETYFVKVI